MRTRCLPLLLAVGLTATCTPGRPLPMRAAAPAAPCPGGELTFAAGQEVEAALAVFTRWAESTRRARGTPGVSVAIVRGGRTLYARGFGLADVEAGLPATAQTPYRIASITKLLTATAALRLWDQGALTLDGPAHLWVPELVAPPRTPAPSVRDLLRHTSGLPRDFAPAYFTDAAFPAREQVRAQIATLHQDLPAATVGKYSNAAYAVLGEVVAAASGVAIETYVDREVLAPLRMEHTVLAQAPGPAPRAAGYGDGPRADAAARRLPWRAAGVLTAAGGATSTAEDLAALAATWLGHGPSVLSRRALDEARAPQWHDPEQDLEHGLGIFVAERDGLRHLRHFGLLDGFASMVDLVPSLDIGVIVLTNAADGAPGIYTRQAIALLRAALDHEGEADGDRHACVPACPYLGDYGFDEVRQLIWQHGAQLFMLAPGEDDAWRHPTRLMPAGPHTFIMQGGPWTGEPLHFVPATDGPASEMFVSGIRWPRLPPP